MAMGGTTTSDSLPTSMVVLSALAPKDRVFDGAMPLPPVEWQACSCRAEKRNVVLFCKTRRVEVFH